MTARMPCPMCIAARGECMRYGIVFLLMGDNFTRFARRADTEIAGFLTFQTVWENGMACLISGGRACVLQAAKWGGAHVF